MTELEKYKHALERIAALRPGNFNTTAEHEDGGNLDDSYEYGVECGEFYAAEIARGALKEASTNNSSHVARYSCWKDAVNAAIEAINAVINASDMAEATQGWRPIETAPRDGTKFLASDEKEIRITFDGATGDWMCTDQYGETCWEPTLWQALPMVPKSKQEQVNEVME